MTQQDWLRAAYARLQGELIIGAPPVEKVVITYGFPSKGARSTTKARLGECHYSAEGEFGIKGYSNAIFIHPRQWGKPLDVLHVLVHEMAHTATPGCGHRGKFVELIRAIGLEGRPTATEAGPELAKRLNDLAVSLGEFPKAQLIQREVKKKGSRLRLWECECEIPVKVRVASDDYKALCLEGCNARFKQQEG